MDEAGLRIELAVIARSAEERAGTRRIALAELDGGDDGEDWWVETEDGMGCGGGWVDGGFDEDWGEWVTRESSEKV